MCCGSISCCAGTCCRERSWLGVRRMRRTPSTLAWCKTNLLNEYIPQMKSLDLEDKNYIVLEL